MKKIKKKKITEVTSDRWNIAQESEKDYWSNYDKNSIFKESGERNPRRVKIMMEKWRKLIKINNDTKILQIGCGPEDVINYFPTGKCYSIDPLADFYKERFNLDYKKSGLIKGTGENLPFPDKYFDIVILTNVLDHVYSPEKVLNEIKRVMKDSALFHFEVYIYQRNFLRLAKVFNKFKWIIKKKMYNIHHPYMFIKEDVKSLLSKNFSILHETIGFSVLDDMRDMNDLKRKKRATKKLTVKIPAFFGLYGIINYTAICKLNNSVKKL